MPLVFLLAAEQGSYRLFWTLFGTSNQLLAALSLLAITVWLRKLRQADLVHGRADAARDGGDRRLARCCRRGRWSTRRSASTPWINGLVSAVLLALAVALVIYAVRAWREPATETP